MTQNSKFAKTDSWFRKRGLRYTLERLLRLVSRYGLSPWKAKHRTLMFVDLLSRHGVSPTLAIPGRIVSKHPVFIRRLQKVGVEVAVHGFDHVDFRSLSVEQSVRQFTRAAAALEKNGIDFQGFRCPYLSFSHDMAAGVPHEMFRYSSNEAVSWDVVPEHATEQPGVIFKSLAQFYRASPADETVVLPRRVGDLLELPVSLPDDLQLLDGLGVGDAGVRDAWLELLRRSHDRGELFVVLVHPESYFECAGALESLLTQTQTFEPKVWTARLCDIADWWSELEQFRVQKKGATVVFHCSERATILVRGIKTAGPTLPWHGADRVLLRRSLDLGEGPMPFVGVPRNVPEQRVAFLRSLGFIVRRGADASACSVYLTEDKVASATNRQLLDLVESNPAPLVRFWHWPSRYRSALAVTGDLDALSLLDYAARVVTL